jgi:hypothetical protein
MHDVVAAKESGREGTTQTYRVNEAQAWDIAKTIFRWEGSDAIEEHRDQHYMLTSSGMNLVSYGRVMGAWVEPVDATNSRDRGDQAPLANQYRNDADRRDVPKTLCPGGRHRQPRATAARSGTKLNPAHRQTGMTGLP